MTQVVVADGGRESCRFPLSIVVELISHCLNPSNVGTCHELLEVTETITRGKRKDELRVDLGFLDFLSCHLEIGHEILKARTVSLDSCNDCAVVRGVVSFDVARNGFRGIVLLELFLGKQGPDLTLVCTLGILLRTLQIVEIVQEHTDGFLMMIELLVNLKCLF